MKKRALLPLYFFGRSPMQKFQLFGSETFGITCMLLITITLLFLLQPRHRIGGVSLQLSGIAHLT